MVFNGLLVVLPLLTEITSFICTKSTLCREVSLLRDNAAQQWWYSTILAVNAISNNGKFAKMVHPDVFGEDGGRSSHQSDLENQ